MSNEYQVFATIYETEGLEHHMAVERAHVSWTLEKKKSFPISEHLWEIGC